MAETCKLEEANGRPGRMCDGESCLYWRVAGHLGVTEEVSGCAVQHFEMLEQGAEMARWLLSVKERVEAQADGCGEA